MPAPNDFPLLPPDRRFHERLDRMRARDPPPPAPDPGPRPEPYLAHILLRALLRRSRVPAPAPRRPAALTRAVPRTRVPPRAVRGVSVLVAAGLLPIGIIFCLVCRPGLPGRRLRARQVTPHDVRRVLWRRDLPAARLLTRFRV